MKKKLKVIFIILFFFLIFGCVFLRKEDISVIHNEKELEEFYSGGVYKELSIFEKMAYLPFSILINARFNSYQNDPYLMENNGAMVPKTDNETSVNNNDYSKTNIQVEDVDEADIIKTDGKYIYSISKKDVVITNVSNPDEIIVESTINENNDSVPMDLIINNDKLIVISLIGDNSYQQDTIINIYDISNKKSPLNLKSIRLYNGYYTSRIINNKLYIFSKGVLRKENNKILRDYMIDNNKYMIDYNNIKYIKNYSSSMQTLICRVDLANLNKINIDSYLMDISNAYVSKNAVYLLDNEYSEKKFEITKLFGLKGVLSLFDYDEYYSNYTTIFKFDINDKKGIKYNSKIKVKGETINQYSLDEYDNLLRVSLESDEGTRIVVFDKNLTIIGESISVAKGERMYASRFINDKAYLVTYKNTDPLFVIDLSDSTKPKFMGELHIPGYSTYLHPYDETHLIGIGVDTDEVISRDENGRVISDTAVVDGMKMSLFDISDINNPIEIAKTTIGNRYTTSAILTNPKALLFSKEKNLLAIPVNFYDEKVVDNTNRNKDDYDRDYTKEGYFVYNINHNSGFILRGIINHDKSKSRYSSYYNDSKLLRGLYIGDNLFTVSESAIKVNDLNTLKDINSINLEENGVGNYEK